MVSRIAGKVVGAVALLAAACGGGGGSGGDGGAIGQTVAGTISGTDAAGVTLTLSGPAAKDATVTSGGDGTYRFDGRPDGEYTVTPSRSGDMFSPASRAVTVAGAAVTGVDFSVAPAGSTATVDRVELVPATAPVDGMAVPYSAVLTNWTASGLGDVALQAWIEQGQARRRANWQPMTTPCAPVYGVLSAGTCTLAAALGASNSSPGTGTLVPGSATLAVELVQGAALTLLDDLRLPIELVAPRSISGQISGATAVSLSGVGAGGSNVGLFTGSSTTYTLQGLRPGSWVITPSKSGYAFTPASRTVDVSAADATGADFTAAIAASPR